MMMETKFPMGNYLRKGTHQIFDFLSSSVTKVKRDGEWFLESPLWKLQVPLWILLPIPTTIT